MEAEQRVFIPSEIPEAPVLQDGRKFRLKLEETIPLPLDDETPALGGVRSFYGAKAIVDDALVLIDETSLEVHAFSLTSGEWLRTIGSRERGPGEYLGPSLVSWNAQGGQLYVVDSNLETTRVYGWEEGFLYTEDKLQQAWRLHFDSAGNSYQLMSKPLQGGSDLWSRIWRPRVMAVRKADPSRDPVYSLVLGQAAMTKVLEYLHTSIGLCYSERLDRLYYLEPWEYRIKEIDAATGTVLRRFGVKPGRYIDLRLEVSWPVENMGRIDQGMGQATMLRDMVLVDETRLLVRHRHGYARKDMSREDIHVGAGIVYDLTRDEIQGFPVPPEDLREWIRGSRTPTGTVSREGFLYTYKGPSEEELNSNGRVEVFSTHVE